MSVITFRERMAGSAEIVPARPVDLPRRGPACGDTLTGVGTTVAATGTTLDLAGLEVRVDGVHRERDGYHGTVERGRVGGVVVGNVDTGFVDLLTRAEVGRRMYYRLLVRPDLERGWVIVEGVKELRHGVLGAWSETTTLHARAVRPAAVDLERLDRAADRGWLLAGAFAEAEELATGTLRVRGLLRQAASMRGSHVRFLSGFARRVVR